MANLLLQRFRLQKSLLYSVLQTLQNHVHVIICMKYFEYLPKNIFSSEFGIFQCVFSGSFILI